ncbi:hypothetical protein BGZ60DRAFT_504040 [Tricladium varicosporioides]|nr:hypothetical protein BGZ60DRAFT_504040 [Hymenoscyphus varicosporioides]
MTSYKPSQPPPPLSSPNNPPLTRHPYHGSCHCGHTKYIVYLTLPPLLVDPKAANSNPTSSIRIRKCNCSTCHKMSSFHIRLMDAPNDFLLLSPLNPESGGLADYTCGDGEIHFYFCPKCGVRCFTFYGESEVRELEVEVRGEVEMRRVWTPKREGWVEPSTGCLNVNAATIEPGQDGFDMREWHEKKWIHYLDMKDEVGDARLGEPHNGGLY